MPELAWIDWKKDSFLPGRGLVKPGKLVTLHANGLGKKRLPKAFVVYQVPSKCVSWALGRINRPSRVGVSRLAPRLNPGRLAPKHVVESATPLGLLSAGPFHMQRWQFDFGSHQSPIVRTGRMAAISIKAGLPTVDLGGNLPIGITVEGTLATSTDPEVRLQPVFPWSDQSPLPSLRDLLRLEFQNLPSRQFRHELGPRVEGEDSFLEQGIPTAPSPFVLARTDESLPLFRELQEWLPQRALGVEFTLDTPTFSLDEGEWQNFTAQLRVAQGSQFLMALAAIDTSSNELLGVSEFFGLFGGRIFFSEG